MPGLIVGADGTGRTCPFCRFPLKTGTEAYACDSCGAVHHADCWRDGQGCAVFGCASAGAAAPAAGASASVAASAADPSMTPPASHATTGSQLVAKLSRDDWIMLGISLLLMIDLLALPWFSFLGISLTATGSPDSWAGIFALLATLALGADLSIERISRAITIPAVTGSRTKTRLVLAILAAVFIGLKFLLQVHFSYLGIGFYGGVILTAALVYGALKLSRGQALLPN